MKSPLVNVQAMLKAVIGGRESESTGRVNSDESLASGSVPEVV